MLFMELLCEGMHEALSLWEAPRCSRQQVVGVVKTVLTLANQEVVPTTEMAVV